MRIRMHTLTYAYTDVWSLGLDYANAPFFFLSLLEDLSRCFIADVWSLGLDYGLDYG
jgi:hypothetical protein